MCSRLDISFDFRSDTPGYPNADPRAISPTLRTYQKCLWSKRLPSGVMFTLDGRTPPYLHHRSDLGEFFLSSGAVIPTFSGGPRLASIMSQIPFQEREAFNRITHTIGGMMLFPGHRVDGKMTINVARGLHPRIRDRFDLTVECIRRHYRGEPSPLTDTLARYADFFALFGSFQGYVEYFLLQDLVNGDGTAVKFFAPFDDFTTTPIPESLDAYRTYRQRATEFVEARGRRILQASSGLLKVERVAAA
jgi:hypothetical protein